MKSLWKCLLQCTLVIAASAGTVATLVAQDDQQAGIVRISSRPHSSLPTSGAVVQTNAMMADGAACNAGTPGMGCEFDDMCDANGRRMHRRLFGRRCRHGDGWNGEMDGYATGPCHGGCRGGNCNDALCNYLRCKFGYFIPTGGGGQGIPWVGHYSRVYPVSPYYADSRDGQAWAAQGYGVPISVPLAPVVGHTYEYGWGVPSSRLTPVSRPAY